MHLSKRLACGVAAFTLASGLGAVSAHAETFALVTINQQALFFSAFAHRVNQRQCAFTFCKIITDILAHLFSRGQVIHNIVDQLEGGA